MNNIIKEAYKCFSLCKGNCPSSFKYSHSLSEVCFYCLKDIRGFKPPDNLKSKFINKKEGSDDTLKLSLGENIKEIEIPKYEIKRFKFPIDLIEFSLKKPSRIIKKQYYTNNLELYLKGYYGKYYIDTPRKYKLMDIRTLLAILYFMDYHKDRYFKEEFKNWLDLMGLESTGFYRKSILEGLEYLLKTIFYTPYIYDIDKKQRGSSVGEYYQDPSHFGVFKGLYMENSNLTYIGKIDYHNLVSFAAWNIINSYHHVKELNKKSSIEVDIGTTFYERIFKNKYFTLIDFKKILPLRDIALNLYLFIKRQDPKSISNYTIDFELLKAHIGITTKNITWARKIFEKIWKDIKNRELLKGYRHRIFTSKKDKREYIKFLKQISLKPINN